ncbi:hypothetical protein QOZ83_16990 [Romboutsia sedimentorum]|uniref:hypothetical protein n=1 Tax=Romboutsia sedimentorum TaxID=1368474 RepID=UPI0024DEB765|nr:hypothetical protein [Romboutsia sedimentorum]MDK2587536.1 hypothetical protein [Romboutsia sedimentorum]
MDKELISSESFLFGKNESLSINFLEKIFYFIETYKLSLETISILTKIDIEKLNDFYYKNGLLHYDELSLINKVIVNPFEIVFKTAELNYETAIESQEELRKLRELKK